MGEPGKRSDRTGANVPAEETGKTPDPGKGAAGKGLSLDVLREAGVLTAPLAAQLDGLLSPDEAIDLENPSMPVYGNYCGMGHGDPTGKTPPLDAVDAVCRDHDLCYEAQGDFDRRCDEDFVSRMPDAIARTPSLVGKKAGLLALLYFSVAERNLSTGRTLFKRD